MPLDLETPVVISHSLDAMRYKADVSITQTLLNLQTEFRYLQIPPEQHQIYIFLTLENESPRKPNSHCSMSDREPVDPQTHSIKQPTASLSHQAVLLNYSEL